MERTLGSEASKDHKRRVRESFYQRYLSGSNVLDIGFRGGNAANQPITEAAIGVDLDYPGYDGRTLPFPDESQDAVFASHCLEHIRDYREVLADWYRVLKFGGFLIIAVPHRDLYERKRFLPSRFNGDHRRLYSPASLLFEIESSLPRGGHRLRSMKDIDAGFDYFIPPEKHALGSYEIELVIEKIKPPPYYSRIRGARELESYIAFFAQRVAQMIMAEREGDHETFNDILSVIKDLPIPPLPAIRSALYHAPGMQGDEAGLDGDIRSILSSLLAVCPFDANYYRSRYADLATFADNSLRQHYIAHGFYEGRKAVNNRGLFDIEDAESTR